MPWVTYQMVKGNTDPAFTVLCVILCVAVLVAFGILIYKIHKHKQ